MFDIYAEISLVIHLDELNSSEKGEAKNKNKNMYSVQYLLL